MLKTQQRTNTPLIGSGKIKRIIGIYNRRNRKGIDPIKLQKRNEKARRVKLKDINFKTRKVKLIFLHWNAKGWPFTKHQLREGIIVSRGINKAYRANKKYSTQAIINAIDLCHETFTSAWFAFKPSLPGIKHINFHDFFKYDDGKLKEIKKHHKKLYKAGITSWFEECIKGEEYLIKKYSFFKEDVNPLLTSRLKDIWGKYDDGQPITGPKDTNLIITFCDRAVAFAELNEGVGAIGDPLEVVETVDRLINQFKLFKPRHLGYLLNNIFWSRQLPKELVRWGSVSTTDRHKIKLLDTR